MVLKNWMDAAAKYQSVTFAATRLNNTLAKEGKPTLDDWRNLGNLITMLSCIIPGMINASDCCYDAYQSCTDEKYQKKLWKDMRSLWKWYTGKLDDFIKVCETTAYTDSRCTDVNGQVHEYLLAFREFLKQVHGDNY